MKQSATLVAPLLLLSYLVNSQLAYAHLHTNTGRFLQRDTFEYVDGMSQYQYLHSNPILYRDPNGLEVIIAVIKTKTVETLKQVDPDTNKEKKVKYLEGLELVRDYWNLTLQAAREKADSPGIKTYKLNGKEILKPALLEEFKNLHMTVEVVDNTKGPVHVVSELHKLAIAAGPKGQVFFETHGDHSPPQFGIDSPPTILLGSKSRNEYFSAAEVGAKLGKFHAKLGFGSCFLRKQDVQLLADKIQNQVAGSPGLQHNILNPHILPEVNVEDGALLIQLVTPFEQQQFNASPKP
jgi:hypothetical protein